MAHTMATSSSERNSAHLPGIRWFLWRKFRAQHYWLRPFLLFKEPLAVASAFVLPISPVKDPHKREVFVERWPVQPKW